MLAGPGFSVKLNAKDDGKVKKALFQFLHETKGI
jgi:hypothetical protein